MVGTLERTNEFRLKDEKGRSMDLGLIKGVRVRMEYVHLTPKMAEQLLALNEVNRSLNNDRVAQIANDIATGVFAFVADRVLIFTVADEAGRPSYLLDGQHRLWAICEAAKPEGVPFLIARMEGTREQMIRSMTVIDKGASRSLNQDTQISRKMGDVTYDIDLSNRALTLAQNALFYADKVLTQKSGARQNKRVSVPMKEAYAKTHIGEVTFLAESVAAYRQSNHTDPATGWLTGLLIAYRLSPKRAARFWRAVSVGVDHPLIFTQSPAFVLHDLMHKPLNVIMAKQDSGGRVAMAASLFVKMWNAHVAGRVVKSWRLDQTFPTALPHPDEDDPFNDREEF